MQGINIKTGWYTRPFFGERHNGDAVFLFKEKHMHTISIIDSTGHGPEADKMSHDILNFFSEVALQPPDMILERIGAKFPRALGAAMGVLQIDTSAGLAVFSGVGNTTTRIIGQSNSEELRSVPGIICQQHGSLNRREVSLSPGDTIIMYSDGISAIDVIDLQEKLTYPPVVIAKDLVIDRGSVYDDSTCIVVKILKGDERS